MSSNAALVLKQLKELQRNPLPRVGVAPTEDDCREWHVNFFFPADHEPYPSLVLHFQLSFPPEFPSASPNVVLLNTMKHSHVHGNSVCFSLLPDFRGYFEATNTPRTAFWNPTRTARSFLEDLYTFLLVDEDQHCTITPADAKHTLAQAAKLTCACGHTNAAPAPAMPAPAAFARRNDNAAAKPASGARAQCPYPDSTVEDLRCAVSQADFFDEGVVMGFGALVVDQGRGRRQITTDLYPMCYKAFRDGGLTVSAGGSEISHFMPFAINREHWGAEARRVFNETVAKVTRPMNMKKQDGTLFVLGELWKSKAVELMSGTEHASEKALKGFCAIHHLLLSCARDDPSLVSVATQRVRAFAESPDNSTKDKVPDLGQFLPLLLLSDVSWGGPEKAGMAVVKELLLRNALWITKAHPELAAVDRACADRVEKSWEPSATGLKLVTFQIRFILALEGWVRERLVQTDGGAGAISKDPKNLRQNVLDMYDAYGGRPSESMIVQFQAESKRVQALEAYNGFFGAIQLGMPTKEQCQALLEEAMRRSEQLGYHGGARGGGRGRGGGGGGGGGARFDNSGRRRY